MTNSNPTPPSPAQVEGSPSGSSAKGDHNPHADVANLFDVQKMISTILASQDTIAALKEENAALRAALEKARKGEDELLAACKAMHNGMDVLFATLIENIEDYFPSKSSVWPAIVQGNKAIKKAEAALADLEKIPQEKV